MFAARRRVENDAPFFSPTVANEAGIFPLVDGIHFVRADGPAEFARAVVSLLRDPDRRRALGRAGRHLVEARYSWATVAREFETRCEPVSMMARRHELTASAADRS